MTPRVLGIGMAILAIVWAVVGLLKLWTNARSRRERAALIDEYDKYSSVLAAEVEKQYLEKEEKSPDDSKVLRPHDG
jgi:hypothetical protein